MAIAWETRNKLAERTHIQKIDCDGMVVVAREPLLTTTTVVHFDVY